MFVGGRSDRDRTGDLRFPKPMRYQAALRSVKLMADAVGFGPTKAVSTFPVFKAGAFNHSAKHPITIAGSLPQNRTGMPEGARV